MCKYDCSADFEQREKEKTKIEKAFRESDKKLGELVASKSNVTRLWNEFIKVGKFWQQISWHYFSASVKILACILNYYNKSLFKWHQVHVDLVILTMTFIPKNGSLGLSCWSNSLLVSPWGHNSDNNSSLLIYIITFKVHRRAFCVKESLEFLCPRIECQIKSILCFS